ncbi:hypothetical protein BDV95DRAFT_601337 [Massariosphaeria phaeospora]|uniref:Uncharacterized protein n=1 Tax=Massariosphaeria phaeospora TaxID=100035 RepID=A0A7C8IGA4_9PLEO|nr:hypothetical protein BDV95DRAFT_601337 [Massariosphaeria phaeospora]
MADFEANTRLWELPAAMEADQNDNCIVIDVGRDIEGHQMDPRETVTHDTELLLDLKVPHHEGTPDPQSVTKLYVMGEWNATYEEYAVQMQDKGAAATRLSEEWELANIKIGELIEGMPNLKELTWVSTLPFMETAWKYIPTTVTKLIIDVGRQMRYDPADPERKIYMSMQEMKPLVNFSKLEELRLFSMQEPMQCVIWETVFRNEADSGAMQVLELRMASFPLVRHEDWLTADQVTGLKSFVEGDQEYKGIEGKGILHHAHGTGEYLDDYCMKKARIASMLDETKPLPLWCLKLDGFVVDALPFHHELRRIVLLVCDKKCVDAGLRPPKSSRAPHNKWGARVNNALSHCLVQWPNWSGIFDNEGNQIDLHDSAVGQGKSPLAAVAEDEESTVPMPLDSTFLDMDRLSKAIEDHQSEELAKVLAGLEVAKTPMGTMSTESVRASPVPAPDDSSAEPASPGTGLKSSEAGDVIGGSSSENVGFKTAQAEQASRPFDKKKERRLRGRDPDDFDDFDVRTNWSQPVGFVALVCYRQTSTELPFGARSTRTSL